MSHVHAGGARWRREQERLKKRQLKAELAELRRRDGELRRQYTRAFERAVRIPERRGAAAIDEAFDQADHAMNRLISSQAAIEQLEARLRATR